MRWFNLLSIGCLLGLFLGCGGIGLAYQKRLVGNLGLAAVDTRKQMAVVEFNGNGADTLVSQTVFAVGWDESHLLVKQHPADRAGEIDKATTQYFIITVRDRKVHGPFDEAKYHSERQALGVAEGLAFTLTFDDLE
jgi:hypothetical protein